MKKQQTPPPVPEYVAVKGGWISVEHPQRRRGRPTKSVFYITLSLRHERGVFRTLLIKGKNDYSWCDFFGGEGLEDLCPKGGLPSR